MLIAHGAVRPARPVALASRRPASRAWHERGTALRQRRGSRAVRASVPSSTHQNGTEAQSQPVPELGGGGGAGSGGSNGGGGGGGDGGADGAGSPGFSGNMWALLAVSAAAVAIFQVYQRNKKANQQEQGGQAPAAARPPSGETDVVVLRRLVQEAFADLVKVRSRLDELEDVIGIAESDPSEQDPDATPLVGGGGKKKEKSRRPALSASGAGRAGRHHLGAMSGTLELGGGLLWAPEEEQNVSDLLPAAGVKLGADMVLRMQAAPRDGRDAITAECRLNPTTEQFSLKKVLYYFQLAPALKLALAPFGATGQDTAYTLNPLAGQGMAAMVRHGSPLHQRPLGSLVGASLDLKKAWASAGYSMQGMDSGGVRKAILAQALVAATPNLSLGLSALQQEDAPAADAPAAEPPAPTPRGGGLPSILGAATPRGGVLAVGTPRSSSGLLGAGTPRGLVPSPAAWDQASGGASQAGSQLGAMFAWRPDPELVVHGWAAADGDALLRGLRERGPAKGLQPEQWGLSLGSYPDGTGTGWAVGLGRSAAVAAAAGGEGGSSSGSSSAAPNLFEVSLQLNAGEGVLVTPGVLCTVQGGRTTLFAGLKTTWDW